MIWETVNYNAKSDAFFIWWIMGFANKSARCKIVKMTEMIVYVVKGVKIAW